MAFKSERRVEPHWYVPEDQEEGGPEKPLRFKIRALTASEQADILGSLSQNGADVRNFRNCFEIGCMEIEEAYNLKGKPVRNPASFMMLEDSFNYVIEVGAVIFDKSFVTEEEKKT